MATVTQYLVAFNGSPDGYQGTRAQIELSDGQSVLGWVRFHDPGMSFPADSQSGAQIIMHLPSTALASVIDVLRNESPINFFFNAGRAFLHTATYEAVGEDDS